MKKIKTQTQTMENKYSDLGNDNNSLKNLKDNKFEGEEFSTYSLKDLNSILTDRKRTLNYILENPFPDNECQKKVSSLILFEIKQIENEINKRQKEEPSKKDILSSLNRRLKSLEKMDNLRQLKFLNINLMYKIQNPVKNLDLQIEILEIILDKISRVESKIGTNPAYTHDDFNFTRCDVQNKKIKEALDQMLETYY